MIFSDVIDAFKNDYMLECIKRGTERINFNVKQIKLIFSKVLNDLQKELKIIESALSITSVNGTAAYALSRSYLRTIAAYYDGVRMTERSVDWITHQNTTSTATGDPTDFAVKRESDSAYLLLYPTPTTDGDAVVVRYYDDFKIYSYSEGLDSKISSTFHGYLNIPTMYDAAILLGMLSQLFDDRIFSYSREKTRLKYLKSESHGFDYKWSGVPSTPYDYYNSDVDTSTTRTSDYKSNVSLAGTKDSSNTLFIISDTPVTDSESIYLNGVKQVRGVDYTISGSRVTMTIAPVSGDYLTATYLISVPNTISTIVGVDLVGTKNGINTSFTLPDTPITGTVEIYLNGSLQVSGTDYTLSGTAVTMTTAPASTDYLEANYLV